ncbi:MAG TPA: LysR family transcriptional regulator [Casimicrobiaceae bacterium]|nr:LysR family transcriptional regulator [Casimicrobiaceae bacterium]
MPRKFDLTSLQLFVAVCECKSIAQAAEVENITASAISKRVSQLEELAGTPLLTRTRSGVAPTRAGHTLLEHARNVLHNLDQIERDLASGADQLRGYVRVFANASAIGEFLPASVVSFLASPKHRDIDIQIEEMTSHDVIAGVKDGLASLGVCWAESDLTGLEWMPCGKDHLSLVVPAKHPLAAKQRIAFAETLHHEHVGLRTGSAVTALLRRESVRAGQVLRYRVLVSTFDAAIRVVGAGLAVAVVPAEIAAPYATVAGIKVVPLSDDWAERRFAVCCRNRRALPKPAAQFLSHLLAASGN